MTRLISWITSAIREPENERPVHFHAASGHQPEVCFDARCRRPSLDV